MNNMMQQASMQGATADPTVQRDAMMEKMKGMDPRLIMKLIMEQQELLKRLTANKSNPQSATGVQNGQGILGMVGA